MTRAEKLQDVINQALTSEEFAGDLRNKGILAQQSSVGSAAWINYVTLFARNAQDLSELSTLTNANGACTVPTSLTLTTISTKLCTTTTTFTTTSYFCPQSELSAQAAARKKAIGKKRRSVK